jgi:hypothetical protein
MKRRLAVAAAAMSLAAVGAAPAPMAAANSPVAHASCTQAKIMGQSKCIQRGQFCTHSSRANRDYKRYGFYCGKQDAGGRYHLIFN